MVIVMLIAAVACMFISASGTLNSCAIGLDEQETGEVESVERQAEPCGPPGEPLVFGRFPLPAPATVAGIAICVLLWLASS
jgi:hypothetical protein